MRNASDYHPVSPELLAEKLSRARNFENDELLAEITDEPRLAEALWYLAHVSRNENYRGGLRRFALDLIEDSRDLLGPEELHADAGSDELSESAVLQIAGTCWRIASMKAISDLVEYRAEIESYSREPLPLTLAEMEEAGISPPQKPAPPKRSEVVERLASEAREDLAGYLFRLCERPDTTFSPWSGGRPENACVPWYFPRVSQALLRFMDRRAAETASGLADTEVKREIFRALDRVARMDGRALFIEGNSRAGKTEAIKAKAAMHPGRFCIVYTPPSGGEGDFIRAVAEANGVFFTAKDRPCDIRARLAVVMRESRRVLIFEEGHRLYPSAVSRNTNPSRLNWVRHNVLDAGLPCAVVWTSQSHRDARNRFLKATGYAIEQWDGRVASTLHLPEEIGREDMLAIARKHLPGLPPEYAEVIVGTTEGRERNYCSDVSTIARFAFLNAEDAGRKIPTLDDLEAAITEFFQNVQVAPPAKRMPAPRKVAATAMQRPRTAPADADPRPLTATALPASRAHFEDPDADPELAPVNRLQTDAPVPL